VARSLEAQFRASLAAGSLALPADELARLEESPDILEAFDALFVEGVRKESGPEVAERARGFILSFADRQGNELTQGLSQSIRPRIKSPASARRAPRVPCGLTTEGTTRASVSSTA